MPLPTPSGLTGAVGDLGLGNMLSAQVKDETDEMRKKRMQQQQQQMGQGSATSMLLGMPGGYST